MNYIESMREGLFLDDYNVLLKWELTSDRLIDFFSKGNIPFKLAESIGSNIIEYSIESKLFNLDIIFYVEFRFLNDNLNSVSLRPLNSTFNFKQMQNYLITVLGKARSTFFKLKGVLFEYYWSLEKVKIIHQLTDGKGFGYDSFPSSSCLKQERIYIILKKNSCFK